MLHQRMIGIFYDCDVNRCLDRLGQRAITHNIECSINTNMKKMICKDDLTKTS